MLPKRVRRLYVAVYGAGVADSKRSTTAATAGSSMVGAASAKCARLPVKHPASTAIPTMMINNGRTERIWRRAYAVKPENRWRGRSTPVSSSVVIRVDAATVLLQWATGGLFFCWFTTRRRQVGLGYGWLLRGTYALMAASAFACGLAFGVVPVREVASAGVFAAAVAALI